MRAVICTKYGNPEVLQIKEVEKPVPNANEFLVKIVATTVNSGDVRVRSLDVKGFLGIVMRLVLGISRPRKSILGTTFSGVVERIGNNVTKFKIGDKVFGMTGFNFGTYADYITLNQNSNVTQMPDNATFDEAAAMIFGGQTAVYFLGKAGISKITNKKILIIGATGSVGVAALQIAKYHNADLTAVCSSEGYTIVKSLGVSKIICYDRENLIDCKQDFDIIFDAVGKYSKKKFKHLLDRNGTYVSVSSGYASENINQLEFLKELFKKGAFKVIIDKVYPMNSVVEAHRYVDTGRKKGNVVLRITEKY